jgi:DNA-binding HxlR family transcriptional regulator
MNKAICSDGLPQIRDDECPIFYAIRLIGQKWKIPILWKLTVNNTMHYNELKRQVAGITNTALTRCLRELEAFGLVNRLEHGTIPPSVEYSLTERGKALLPTLNELNRWGASLTAGTETETISTVGLAHAPK